jgi:8-oxo-dGTP diphosphatase
MTVDRIPWRGMSHEEEVRAAGGVVVRDGDVAVVHRPKYDDWSLPKGKLDPGESWEEAAVREVEEETGVRARIIGELPPARYRDRKGRPKTVRWYRMDVEAGGTFEPNEEVDELRWLPPEEAGRLVSYDHDRALLATIV